MKIEREDFNNIQPLHHVLIKIDTVQKRKIGSIFIPFTPDAERGSATHYGVVVKHPIKKSANISCHAFTSAYEIEIGDTVYFGWNVYKAYSDSSDDKLYEVDDEVYILIEYQDLMLCERGDECFGLNEFVGGYHPNKKTTHIIESASWGDVLLLQKNIARAHMNTGRDEESLVITHPLRHRPEYHVGELIPTHLPAKGDVVYFRDGSCMPIGIDTDQGEIMVLNTMFIAAHHKLQEG